MSTIDTTPARTPMSGAQLRAIRTLCDMTPRQFADKVGVSTKTLTSWELSDQPVYDDVRDQALADYELFDHYVATIWDEHQGALPGDLVELVMYRHGESPEDLDRGVWNAAVASAMRSLEDDGLVVEVSWA